MLAPKAQYSLTDAKRYFKEHLSVGEYYSEGQQVLGRWYGKGAEALGLSGVTQSEQFLRLCENQHPQTGERLTLRQKTTRTEIGADGVEREHANRRVFYDFTFSPPKSVSVAAFVGNDQRIIEAHEQAVMTALEQLQIFAATRVRKQGQCSDRTTGDIVAAVFRHDTSRALDPHLHSHCIVIAQCHTGCRRRPLESWRCKTMTCSWRKASVKNMSILPRAGPVELVGIRVSRSRTKPRGDFEIKGVSPELIEKFSKRHREIDRKTTVESAGPPAGRRPGGNLGGDSGEHRAQGTPDRKSERHGAVLALQAIVGWGR